jgi:dTMP kinase
VKRRGQRNKRGVFITFEGGEGAGKSTQIRHLVGWLKQQRIPHILTLEPGGSRIGRDIRNILLNPRNKMLTPKAEALLYQADRAQHVAEVILPALQAGKVVVSDRFSDSSAVYQGICRNLGLSVTEELSKYAANGLRPDRVILLDIPEKIGLNRVRKRFVLDPKLVGKRRVVKLDRLEREKQTFHKKVRNGFLLLAKKHRSRFKVVDATREEEDIRLEIIKDVARIIKRKLK